VKPWYESGPYAFGDRLVDDVAQDVVARRMRFDDSDGYDGPDP
jgi:hypothetical protein